MSTPPPSAPPAPLTLFELRRYRARPGRRDALVAMFEAHFRPAYEASGATILGCFTVPGEPEAWVWMRAFAGPAAREAALRAFYGGPVWARLGAACNDTLAEVSSARVLQAVAGGDLAHPPARDALPDAARPWVATVGARPAGLARAALGLDAPAPAPLVLASTRSVVALRRFEAPAEARAWCDAHPAGAGAAHWPLQPTACSRLR